MQLKIIILIVSLSFIGLNTCSNKSKNTKIVSIGFHSDDCNECNVLKSKMKKMNRKFLLSPIVFIKYDHTSEKSKKRAEKKLKKIGFWEIAQQEKGLKHVNLYNAKTKEKIVRLNDTDSVEILEEKISNALSSVE